METMIAFCGLNCENCPIYLATYEQDASKQQAMRTSIAEEIAKIYGMNLQSMDITDCDGCRANTGKLFSICSNCKIRACASQKKIENCAYCHQYACEDLKEFFSQDPTAQSRLDAINKQLSLMIP